MNVEKVTQWIAEGDTDALESAWMAAIDQPSPPVGPMRETLEALVAAGQSEAAETLGWMLLSALAERGPADRALDAARAVLPALPGGADLRDAAVDLYRKVHGQAEHFEDFLRASGLEADQSLRRAVRTLDTCLAVRPGTYMANRFDGQVVRVERFDAVLCQFELTSSSGERMQLAAKLLADEFECVTESDFRVLAAFCGDRFDELLAGDPAAVLIGVCISHGGQIESAALKELLVPRYIEKDKWSSWWNRARTAAKRSQLLSLESGKPTVITYYPQGRSLEDELAGAVDRAKGPLEYLAVLRQYAKEVKQIKGEIDAGFVAPVMAKLADQAESFRVDSPADSLAACLAIDAAVSLGLPGPQTDCPTAGDVLCGMDRPAQAVARLAEPSLLPAALEALAGREDAAEHFEKLLALLPAGQLDEVAARLRAAGRGEAVARAAADALMNPAQNLQICLWLWQGPAEWVEGAGSALELLSRLLSVMQEIGRDWDVDRAARRAAFQQIRSALVADGCRAFTSALEEMDKAVAETIKRRIERSEGLSVTSREQLLSAIRQKFPALFFQEKVAPWLDETVVWITQQSLDRRRAELKELTEVTMPANSRAIGAAAEHGDLSDNSEWQYALEERRRLQGRVSQMQNDLARARVLRPEDVPSDRVGVGSRVVLKRTADGRRIELTFLGPWESDVAQSVYSYKSPLAQGLMGRAVGQTVTLKLEGAEGEYTVDRLASAV